SKAAIDQIASSAAELLNEIQKNLYRQAKASMDANTYQLDSYGDLRTRMEGEGGGGFADIYWCGKAECETKIREETRATCRAIPLDQKVEAGTCIVCGEPASERDWFAKAY